MDYGKPIMVGVCNHCGLKVPIYDTHTRLIMATHGMFEVGAGRGERHLSRLTHWRVSDYNLQYWG